MNSNKDAWRLVTEAAAVSEASVEQRPPMSSGVFRWCCSFLSVTTQTKWTIQFPLVQYNVNGFFIFCNPTQKLLSIRLNAQNTESGVALSVRQSYVFLVYLLYTLHQKCILKPYLSQPLSKFLFHPLLFVSSANRHFLPSRLMFITDWQWTASNSSWSWCLTPSFLTSGLKRQQQWDKQLSKCE